LKDVSEENLFDAIRQAAQGRSPLASSVATRLVQRMYATGEERLSRREIATGSQSSIARSQEYLFDDGSELEANFEFN
jgi:DNA-binding NarL/FixJ family response regulator